MRMLIVENDQALLTVLEESLHPLGEVLSARSRDSAIAEIDREEIDLVICDLKIPTADGSVDDDVIHGLSVHHHIDTNASGTPVIILSGHGTMPVASELLERARKVDVFGTQTPWPMTTFYEKKNLPECLERIRQIAAEFEKLREIELNPDRADLELSESHQTVLRIFSRRRGGRMVHVSPLDGGLSASRVLRVRIVDGSGAEKALAVAKLGRLDDVDDELTRFRNEATRLRHGTFTAELDVVNGGARQSGGSFYSLAIDFERSLFDILESAPLDARQIVQDLKAVEEPWLRDVPQSPTTIGDVRRTILDDDAFHDLQATELVGLDCLEFEDRAVQVVRCSQHCDLHGLNVLVGPPPDLKPLMIDWGDVGPAYAALDPTTLELSALFHPARPHKESGWPSADRAKAWAAHPDDYLVGCPFPEFVTACREWALEVGAGRREIYACAYSYAVRQLKYSDTDHTLARSIIASLLEAVRST